MNNDQIVGTCGLCGGPVTLPRVWHGVIPPAAACSDCGAYVKKDYGPVLPMSPPAQWTTEIKIDPESHKRFGLRFEEENEISE